MSGSSTNIQLSGQSRIAHRSTKHHEIDSVSAEKIGWMAHFYPSFTLRGHFILNTFEKQQILIFLILAYIPASVGPEWILFFYWSYNWLERQSMCWTVHPYFLIYFSLCCIFHFCTLDWIHCSNLEQKYSLLFSFGSYVTETTNVAKM